MKKIIPTEEKLTKLRVKSWGIWEKEKSIFDWSYDATETCYMLEGEVEVTDNKTGEKLNLNNRIISQDTYNTFKQDTYRNLRYEQLCIHL